MITEFFPLLFALVALHYVADFPLQGEYLAKAKNRNLDKGRGIWPHALMAHSMIHGGMVALATGSVWLGVAEVVCHAATDYLKCSGRMSFTEDQIKHLVHKITWAIIATGPTIDPARLMHLFS